MNPAMTILKSLLIAALLAAAPGRAADNAIQVALEDGKTVATFKLKDSRCVLKDERVRCTPIDK